MMVYEIKLRLAVLRRLPKMVILLRVREISWAIELSSFSNWSGSNSFSWNKLRKPMPLVL